MSLNKGSLDKANYNQKLNIEYLYKTFIADETILKGNIVCFDPIDINLVFLADSDYYEYFAGIALENKNIGEKIKICVFGECEVICAGNIAEGHSFKLGVIAGRAYDAFQDKTGSPDDLAEYCYINSNVYNKWCADSSGGSPTTKFLATTSGDIDSLASKIHKHDIYSGKIIGKMLEEATLAGQLKKCFVWLA